MIVIIFLGCLAVVSFLLNVWLTYYICCRVKRRRTGQLTTIEQGTLSRKHTGQNGLENFALDIDTVESCLPSAIPEVVTLDGVLRGWSGKKRKEDAQSSDIACQQEEEPHVYQRVESCMLDPPSSDYLKILESVGDGQINQHPIEISPKKSNYQFLSPRLQEATKNAATEIKGDQEEKHLYQTLLLRNGCPDVTQVSPDRKHPNGAGSSNLRESIPDYVEIISDEEFEANTKRDQTSTQMSQETAAAVDSAFETLKPPPVSVRKEEGTEAASTVFQEIDQSVKREDTDEADYIELLNENEAGEKENAITKS